MSTKNIQNIKIGDLIRNPATGIDVAVKNIMVGEQKREMYRIHYDGKTVSATYNHPFLTSKGVLRAEELRAGDILLNESIKRIPVEKIEIIPIEKGRLVWNLLLDTKGSKYIEINNHLFIANGLATGDFYLQNNNDKANQSEFAKTGGIHASGLFSSDGSLISLREDVGRHNALDKMIGDSLINNYLKPNDQFIACSGRLNFELVQKVLMTNIGLMIGVGAPTSLAIDLANRFDMTLVGFVKDDSFNVYTNNQKVMVN